MSKNVKTNLGSNRSRARKSTKNSHLRSELKPEKSLLNFLQSVTGSPRRTHNKMRTDTIVTRSQLDTDIWLYIYTHTHTHTLSSWKRVSGEVQGGRERDIGIVATKLQGFYVSASTIVINGALSQWVVKETREAKTSRG